MAIDAKLRTELTKYVKLGDKVTYTSRNDESDKKTMTDPSNMLEKAINSNRLELLQAIYDVSSDNKFDGAPFLISMKGNDFMITDTKTAKSDKIKIDLNNTVLTISDKVSKTTTTIELNKVIEQEKGEIKPLKDQIQEAAKNAKSDKDLLKTIRNMLNTK